LNRAELQSVLQQPYQRDRWLEMLREVLPGTDVFASPQSVSAAKSNATSILQLGRVRLHGGQQLALLESSVAEETDLTRNRVGLRNQVARLIDLAEYHGVLAIFHSEDSKDYRFTFAARESAFDADGNLTKRETAPRRYTYVLGPYEACRTAAERFSHLADKAHGVVLNDVIDAFSVDKLNSEFFSAFRRAFSKVRGEMCDRQETRSDATIDPAAQTLLNRLLFLYFVQRKGWLNRQRKYLIDNYRSHHQDKPKATTFHAHFLKPLFQRLSTEDAPPLLGGHDLPFLNGGLFNDEYGEELFKHDSDFFLSNETFGYIFDDLLEPYNFTIHEDSPNNYEVAIDPEMLGHIFEALVLQGEESEARGKSVRHDTGSHYTPRPIVHYVCRNTLAAWLENQPPFAGRTDASRRIDQLFELDATEGIDEEMRLHLDQCLTSNEAAALRDRLFEVRACDPAVGSGAFPMGLLHEVLNLLRLCETRARGKDPAERDPTWLYETKKHIIESVLYGVDIQERAIEICKLRLWLSLMVDHELDVDPFNCEPRSFQAALKSLDPLPNLDFKIRCANSLMDSIHGQVITLGAHNSSDRIRPVLNKLIAAKQDFYDAHSAKEKRRLRFVIYEATAELARFELGWARTQIGLIEIKDAAVAGKVDRAQRALDFVFEQIKEARGAKVAQQESALERIQSWFDDPKKPTFVWQLDFAEVFHPSRNSSLMVSGKMNESSESATRETVRYGFDLMIGNPPYVRIQTLTKTAPEAVAYYKDNYDAAKKGNCDIYVVFVERGLELLDERHGQLGYILPHKFFNSKYGEPLRKLVSKGNHLRHVVHFGDQQIFSGATNYVCLLFLSTASVKELRLVRANNLKVWLATQRGVEGRFPGTQITSSEWNFAVGQGAGIFERLQGIPLKLEDATSRIFQGIKTSADKIYIVEELRRTKSIVRVLSPELETEYELEPDLLHPLIKGGDSKRFALASTYRLILFPYVKNADGRAVLISEDDLKKQYHRTWEYLKANKRTLEDREDGALKGRNWYAYGRTQALDVMPLPKLFTPDISPNAAFSYDSTGNLFFTGGVAGGYGILVKPPYRPEFILGVLNSRPVDFFHHRIATQMRGGWFSYEARFIRHLPIPAASPEQQVPIEQLVGYLLWMYRESSFLGSGLERPQEPAVASFYEQVINALVYELFFSEDIRAAGLDFFGLVNNANLPTLDSLPTSNESRLQGLFDLFKKLQMPGHPLRVALDKLQTLDLVRIIEDK
jgi:adenine-specific DNA-methyltransferase